MSRLFVIGPMICLVLFMGACAGYKRPSIINDAQIRERALIEKNNGIRVAVAVVGTDEAREIFGIDLSKKNIQAIWIEIENNYDRPLVLLPTAIDPEYFAPLEVAYLYHKAFASAANAALNEHLLALNFPIRSPIMPGSKLSGYVFTNRTTEGKVIDVDLLGRKFSQNFTFFVPNPEGNVSRRSAQRLERIYSAPELKYVTTESALRHALERLPCCVTDEDGTTQGEPLNVVIVGEIDDWISGFSRRGYEYQPVNPRYVSGRPQDLSGKKSSRGYIRSQAHFFRIWQTQIQFRDKPVWIAQTSTSKGGRFADNAAAEMAPFLDPYVDHTRNALTQDLIYSQALIKIGYVKIYRPSQTGPPKASTMGPFNYITDGLRVVLVFGERPISFADIEYFDWEQLSDYH